LPTIENETLQLNNRNNLMPLENFFCRLGRRNLGQRFAALIVLTEHIARYASAP
jgi:hypothetical protein